MPLFGQTLTDLALFGSYSNTLIASNCAEACIGTGNGMLIYTYADNKTYHINGQNSNLAGSATSISFDRAGNKWVVTISGLYQVSALEIIKMPMFFEDNTPVEPGYVGRLEIDDYNRIFVCMRSGELYRYEPQNGICYAMYFPNSPESYSLGKSSDGKVYYAYTYSDTLSVYQLDDFPIQISEVSILSINNQRIYNFVIDDQSRMWFSFNGYLVTGKDEVEGYIGGLVVFSHGLWTILPAEQFTTDADYNGFSKLVVQDDHSVIARYNSTFFEDRNVLFSIDQTSNTLVIVNEDVILPYDNYIYRDDYGRDFYQVEALVTIIENGSERVVSSEYGNLSSATMDIDDQQAIWIASNKTIAKITDHTRFELNATDIAPIDFKATRLTCAPDGKVYVASKNGVLEYDGTDVFYHNKSWAELDTCFCPIEDIVADDQNTIWIRASDCLLKKVSGGDWERIEVPFIEDDFSINDFDVFNGSLFVVSYHALYQYKDDVWIVYDQTNSPITNSIYLTYVHTDFQGGAYAGGSTGIFHLTNDSCLYLGSFAASSITVNNQTGAIWGWDYSGVYRFLEPEIQESVYLPYYSSYYYQTLRFDDHGNLIITDADKILVHNDNGIVGYTQEISALPPNFSPEYCREVFENTLLELVINPNPVNDQLVYYFQQPVSGEYTIHIFNLQGECVRSIQEYALNPGMPYGYINVDSLPPGTYVAQVITNNMQGAVKFVKL